MKEKPKYARLIKRAWHRYPWDLWSLSVLCKFPRRSYNRVLFWNLILAGSVYPKELWNIIPTALILVLQLASLSALLLKWNYKASIFNTHLTHIYIYLLLLRKIELIVYVWLFLLNWFSSSLFSVCIFNFNDFIFVKEFRQDEVELHENYTRERAFGMKLVATSASWITMNRID